MDAKTVILGVVPAGLAILLELRSPVSEKVIRTQSLQQSEQFVPEVVTGVVRQQQKNAIATAMTGTAIGAAEVAGLVPTWISLMVALTAGLSEFMDPIWCLTMVIIMTAVAAILGLNFFENLSFYDFGYKAAPGRICRGYTQSRCASRIVIIINIFIAMLLIVVGLWTNFK